MKGKDDKENQKKIGAFTTDYIEPFVNSRIKDDEEVVELPIVTGTLIKQKTLLR